MPAFLPCLPSTAVASVSRGLAPRRAGPASVQDIRPPERHQPERASLPGLLQRFEASRPLLGLATRMLVCKSATPSRHTAGAIFMQHGGVQRLYQNLKDVPPTRDDVERMNAYLGIASHEPSYIWEVSELALSAPLPECWLELKQRDGTSLFKCGASNQ